MASSSDTLERNIYFSLFLVPLLHSFGGHPLHLKSLIPTVSFATQSNTVVKSVGPAMREASQKVARLVETCLSAMLLGCNALYKDMGFELSGP